MRVIQLGCGGSQGVPTATGDWGRCDPADPRDRRTRVSIAIETTTGAGEARTLIIDTGPDFRAQMLAAEIRRIDAVLYTHGHADHVHGIDDLRGFCRVNQAPIPIYGSAATIAELHQRFGYTLQPPQGSFYRPTLIPNVVSGKFSAAGIPVIAFDQDHGFGTTTGFRIGDFAYSTDVTRLDEPAFKVLQGVRVWIVDCVRPEPPHPTHAHLAKTLEWIARVKPERAILTHMDHTTGYADWAARLPAGVEPGCDGLVVMV
jgi:phosphoribosyl 1,2-cyclic phosphate phosphodiesterase